MNFQNIEYFLTVAEYKNFSKAAESLYISQQALSENIKRLEEEIGTPLLVRGKTLSLTPAGECFLSGGQKILKTQDKMLREISVISNTTRCKIVIGVSENDLPPFLPLALSIFSKKYPEYEVVLQSGNTTEIPDLLFYEDTAVPKSMESIPLIEEEPFVVVFSRLLAEQIFGENWASVQEQLSKDQQLAALDALPFLLLYRGKHLHPSYEKLFEEAGFTPQESFKSEDANLLSSLCINGTGAFLGPQDYCRRKFGPLLDAENHALYAFPLRSPVRAALSLIYPTGKHLNQAEKRFVEVLRSSMEL